MDDKGFDYLNVVPLVDVMLVLLAIVLTTSAFIATGALHVDLPRAKVSEPEYAVAQVLVEIDRDGHMTINGQEVERESLSTALAQFSRETPVMVRADRNITVQRFIDVYDVAKVNGFSKLGLQTVKGHE